MGRFLRSTCRPYCAGPGGFLQITGGPADVGDRGPGARAEAAEQRVLEMSPPGRIAYRRRDPRAFAERCEGDRHHFRFIVSPDDAAELADLRAFSRDLVARMEGDFGARLDWVAVDHWNTGHPHVHLIVRGRTDDGQDLVISRD